MNKKKLTGKQKLFCLFYVQSFNATQAYLKAYGGKNRSAAQSSSSKLLLNPMVQEEIKNLQEELQQHYKFELDDYIQQLLKIVGADIGDFVKFGQRDEEVVINKNGDTAIQKRNFVDLVDSNCVDTSLIAEIRQTKGDVTIKLHDKISALKELARIFGFGGDVNQSELPSVLVDNIGEKNES